MEKQIKVYFRQTIIRLLLFLSHPQCHGLLAFCEQDVLDLAKVADMSAEVAGLRKTGGKLHELPERR